MFFFNLKAYQIDNLKWYLDSPKESFTNENSEIELRGWILTTLEHSLLIKFDNNDYIEYRHNCARDDVIKHYNITDSTLRAYGFKYKLKLQCSITFAIKVNHEIKILLEITKTSTLKVLLGKSNYLFLDNDTNGSVDQFTGKYIIKEALLNSWYKYFNELHSIGNKYNIKPLFFVSPAKEEIFPEYYPFERANKTLIDNFMEEFGQLIIYPKLELKNNRELTYYKVDTHWSDYGAYLSAEIILGKLELFDYVKYIESTFKVVQTSGDLGSKIIPKTTCSIFAFVDVIKPEFNNQIHNVGRIWVYLNKDSPLDKKLLIFGDSFMNNMVHLFKSIFRKVIFVHSVSAVDMSIIEQEKVDYLICQTNQRFLVTPPQNCDIFAKCHEKLNKFNISELEKIKNYLESIIDGELIFYKQKMLKLIDLIQNQ